MVQSVTHWGDQEKLRSIRLWIVLVNGRRVDSFLKRRNAVAKARRIRCTKGYQIFSEVRTQRTRWKLCEEYNIYTMKDLIRWLTPERVKANTSSSWDKQFIDRCK
jgi:hypothetical protein